MIPAEAEDTAAEGRRAVQGGSPSDDLYLTFAAVHSGTFLNDPKRLIFHELIQRCGCAGDFEHYEPAISYDVAALAALDTPDIQKSGALAVTGDAV